jgi:hypothetical protein
MRTESWFGHLNILEALGFMTRFQNRQTLAAGVRPSPGAATSVGQERMELRRTCSRRAWLWPRTATLRILKNDYENEDDDEDDFR